MHLRQIVLSPYIISFLSFITLILPVSLTICDMVVSLIEKSNLRFRAVFPKKILRKGRYAPDKPGFAEVNIS